MNNSPYSLHYSFNPLMKRLLKLGQITFTTALGVILIVMVALWFILYFYHVEMFSLFEGLRKGNPSNIKQAF